MNTSSTSSQTQPSKQHVARVRELAGISADEGPSDENISRALGGFVGQIEYWYTRVLAEAGPKYRRLIISRINPFVRRIELGDMSASEASKHIVSDYTKRNFVTAGGWAIERMALLIGDHNQKSSTEGIDIQRRDTKVGDYHLYVVKSGTVTRNSDILKALKQNVRKAEKLLRQGGVTTTVNAYYAIAAGQIGSTFEDGIHRPSSSEFWSHMTGLPEKKAIRLTISIARVAGEIGKPDDSKYKKALECLVKAYIEDPNNPSQVDWEFITKRTMMKKEDWKQEDEQRHELALLQLHEMGFVFKSIEEDGKKKMIISIIS